MGKSLFLSIFLLSSSVFSQNCWINEFHYDNDGTDAGEFIEIVLQNPSSYTLTDFTISLYNQGVVYDTKTLGQYSFSQVDPTDNSFSYYYRDYSPIQNGASDGICLDYQGTVVLLISYEGTFVATDGPANGQTSVEIGITQSSTTTPLGSSVGLTGNGTQYNNFSWTNFDASATKGGPNTNQLLPVELTSFTALVNGGQIHLSWKTATEINNYGFEVERKEDKGEYHTIGFVKGSGNSNSEKEYDFIDNGVSFAGKYQYRLKQIDTDGSFNYSGVVEVSLTAPLKYNLSQNYPNPFNPVTVINYTIPEAGKVKVFLYNIIGETVLTLVDEFKEAGTYSVVLNGRGLRSGTYFYKLQTKNFTEIKKMIILK